MSDLARLQPTTKGHVMDLVQAAGVDVTDWSDVKGGARRARVNPKYCYEWAFVQPGKVVVVNLWHRQLEERDGTITVDINVRQHARKYAKSARPVWLKRAGRMDEALHTAFLEELPVRVVIIDGDMRSWDDTDAQASKVRYRELDPIAWSVTAYDRRTGRTLITRGAGSRSLRRRSPGPWARPDPKVERAAVKHVTRFLEAQGYTVQSFERVVCGYDLHATHGRDELHVEVKGCVGPVARFFISRTELGAARMDRHWRLAVVTTASSRPGSVKLLKHDEMDQLFDLEATHWVATRRLE